MAGHTDTVVKARYSRGGTAAVRLAKEHLRYAVHRSNEQGLRQYREVWDSAGVLDKAAAYERLDRVKPGDHVYCFTLSPHPERQDAGHHLNLRSWTRDMLAQLERDVGQRLEWFAVTHEHPDHRHVHAVVMTRRHLDASQFRSIREVGAASAREQQRQFQLPRQPGRAVERTRELLRAQRRALIREVGR